MSAATNVIRASLDIAHHCTTAYLTDLSDPDLLIRPVPGANHMAWQVGHLIVSEHNLINSVCPGAMPDLPVGFAERYSSEKAAVDDASAFDTKDELILIMNVQRAGTLAALEPLSDEQLDQAAPESIRDYAPTVAATFSLQALHWMMHSGQWVVVRRLLGRSPLF